MPSTDAHLKQAKKNVEFARSFDRNSTPYLDWAVTGLFYSALHYVDACLHEHHTKENPGGYSPSSHEDRTPLVNRNFPSIYRRYRNLKDASEDARYELKSFAAPEVDELENQDWKHIHEFARSRLHSEV